jgi:RsiW-degrading membrane proteinase PrsW (M82 family)
MSTDTQPTRPTSWNPPYQARPGTAAQADPRAVRNPHPPAGILGDRPRRAAVAVPVRRRWYQRAVPAGAGVLLSGLLLYLAVYLTLQGTGDPLFIPTLIVVGATTVPAAFAVYVSRLSGSVQVGARTLGLYALWGGVLGAIVAGVAETTAARTLHGLPFVLVGLFEESAKLLVPLTLLPFVVRLRQREADGLLIGVAVGVGFAVLETMGYAFVTLVASRGDLTVMGQLLLSRAILAPAGHAAWTGLAAAALWRLRLRHTWRAALGFAATFVLVVALHTIWDSAAGWPWYLALAIVSLGLLHLRLWRANRSSLVDIAPSPAPPGNPSPAGPLSQAGPWPAPSGTPGAGPARPGVPAGVTVGPTGRADQSP